PRHPSWLVDLRDRRTPHEVHPHLKQLRGARVTRADARGRRPTLLDPINRMLAESARDTPSPQHATAIAQLQHIARRVLAFWSDIDLVATPTLALPGANRLDLAGHRQRPAPRVRESDPLHPVHAARQRHGPASDVGTAPLARRRASTRRPVHRSPLRRGDTRAARRPARGRTTVARPAARGEGLTPITTSGARSGRPGWRVRSSGIA